MTSPSFENFGLAPSLLGALGDAGYCDPTPIQAQAIPFALAGRDLFGIAQTGSGKTAAYALPLLQRLADGSSDRAPRGLILVPTRELAAQITAALRLYGRRLPLRHCAIYGGVSIAAQIRSLRAGTDIVVATPGRLTDLIKRREIRLDRVETFILDEADRMLDMGFIPDVRRIAGLLPVDRQTLLFSATMPDVVARLADDLLRDPTRIEIRSSRGEEPRIEQRVYFVPGAGKRGLLHELLCDPAMDRVIVFTRTKHGANKVATQLGRAGVGAEALHGNKSQSQRRRALERFRTGRARVLVATDIAARGIDVADISHVVNFDLPDVPETYVHRIGRTARAGSEGVALSFCDAGEQALLRDIERLTRRPIAVAGGEPWASSARHAETGRNRSRSRRSRRAPSSGRRAG